jgi:hopanoid biosynthesis associated RND transporter like protein HpnN
MQKEDRDALATELSLAYALIAGAVALAIFCAIYAARNFSITTDVRQLFPDNLGWSRRERQFQATFPQYYHLVVVTAPTPELTERAGDELADALRKQPDRIRAVQDAQGSLFFTRQALLFQSVDSLARTTEELRRGAPLIGALANDPTLTGLLHALSFGLAGIERRRYTLAAMRPVLTAASDTVDDALAGRPAHFSWRALAGGEKNQGTRRFIEVAPVLGYNALEPGRATTEAIIDTARRLDLAHVAQAKVQVTGLAPMNDSQFSALRENALLNGIVSIGAVLIILWLALRSWQLVVATLISVTCGLAYSAALGILLVKSLNLISVAFFVLFIGLAIDFGIQFSVRYRAERHETGDVRKALLAALRKAGWPLALAGAATALGFSSFLPTNYRGLSELGKIAGPGMIIAFLTSVTLLPALIRVLRPPAEPQPMGFKQFAPIDDFLQRRRVGVLVGTLAVVLLGSPLLAFLKFDFNTLHLQNPNAPAVSAFLAVRKDPLVAANAVEIVTPDIGSARAVAAKLSALPQVASTRTLADLIPTDQPMKLWLIRDLAKALRPILDRANPRAPRSDAEDVAALRAAARQLSSAASAHQEGAGAARHLSGLLEKLAAASPETRQRVSVAMVKPLEISLADLRDALDAQPVTAASIPEDLAREWRAPDGRARVQVRPKGDPDDTGAIRAFVRNILKHAPNATGPAVGLYEAGNTVVSAFIRAGLFALVAIAALLFLALRRISDVALTLIPLLLAAVLTLELCVVLDIPLNFTNILAFPLLLGVGVAFKIYYIIAWRRGRRALVQSTLTRAVLFSALTTATAFGSLWLSHHPGTSSMGQLMMLSLICTMLAAVLFQPALMGPPRSEEHGQESRAARKTSPAYAQAFHVVSAKGPDRTIPDQSP